MRWVRQAAKLRFTPKRWKNLAIRIARHTQPLAPDEWKGSADEKQLQLLTAHPAHRLHSQLNYAELRKKYAVADREPITIHTEDAARFGIANGDLVRVWNKRGQILTGAVVTDGIKKAWYACMKVHGQIWKMACVKTAVRTC